MSFPIRFRYRFGDPGPESKPVRSPSRHAIEGWADKLHERHKTRDRVSGKPEEGCPSPDAEQERHARLDIDFREKQFEAELFQHLRHEIILPHRDAPRGDKDIG